MTDRRCFNPIDGRPRPSPAFMTRQDMETALFRAARAAGPWAAASFSERSGVLHEAARLLRADRASLAELITLEMGKPIAEAEAEIEKSAWNCEFVADNAEGWLESQVVPTQAALSYVAYRPLGTVLAILPWNFPIWQIFRCAVAALMAGNTFILKPAPNVPECAAAVMDLMRRAGVPTGVFENLDLPVSLVGDLISDQRVAAVAFTGSPKAGATVAARAGAACKKSILELGGSDAFIVLADANIEEAVLAAVRGRFGNCGQVCLAAKRFLVEDAIEEEFTARFSEAVAALRIGDPTHRATQLGPMAREDLRDLLDRQVQASVQQGARLVMGGRPLSGPGYFYEPTILVQATPAMPVMAEETFGPVAPLMRVRDMQHAVQVANDSVYGLAAVLWTGDLQRAKRIAAQLQTGSIFINGVTASDPRLPVGGVKLSGYGRELGSAGIREFVNVQSVWIGV